MKTPINGLTREDVERFRTFEGQAPNMLNLYQQIATKSAVYPGAGTPLGLAYVALKMNGEAGEFAEHVGKAMRDDHLVDDIEFVGGVAEYTPGILTRERHTLLVKEVGDVLWYLSAACNELGITLAAAAAINLEKLADRTERDALRGSGDDR